MNYNFSNIRNQIDDTIYERGLDYYEEDRVIDYDDNATDSITARVDGSAVYDVHIRYQGDTIVEYFCNCPYDGDLCKHIAAVLIYRELENQDNESAPESAPEKTDSKKKKSQK